MLVFNQHQQGSTHEVNGLLRDQLLSQAGVASQQTSRITWIQGQLLQFLGQISGQAAISIDDDIFTLGGDALLLLELIKQVEHHFLIRLTANTLSKYNTVASLSHWIDSNH